MLNAAQGKAVYSCLEKHALTPSLAFYIPGVVFIHGAEVAVRLKLL